MVFNKQNKVAFVCPPRTGSTTLHTYLNGQGWFRLREKHESLEDLIKLYPNLVEYKIYGFFRDPLIRFESCILHAKQHLMCSLVFNQRIASSGIGKTVQELSYEDVVDNFSQLFNFGGFLFKPQTFWFNDPRVTALDFHNMKSELDKVIGLISDPIPVLNGSNNFGRSVITDKVRSFVRQHYADDYALAKDRLGKEY